MTFAARFRDAARKITVCTSVRVCGLVEKMQGSSELLERFFSILKYVICRLLLLQGNGLKQAKTFFPLRLPRSMYNASYNPCLYNLYE